MALSLQISPLGRKRLSTVLGLTLDGSRLEGAVVHRTNGSAHLVRAFSATLSLNPLTAGPELVGREIRNCLDAAGVREKTCVVGVPISWVLTAQVEIPDLPEEDVASLLSTESERAFPCDPGSLQIVTIRNREVTGNSTALLAGVPKDNVEILAAALKAAKLQPVSFSLALSALEPAGQEIARSVIAVSIGENNAGLQVSGRDGILSLRALEGALEQQGGRKTLNAAVIAREIRVTLGQLPPAERAAIHRIRIYGPEEQARHLADELDLKAETIGLEAEIARRSSPVEHGLKIPSETPVSGAFSLAAQRLAVVKTGFEFLPPHTSALQRLSKRYASGKLRVAIPAALILVLVPAALFAWQQWRILSLESQWNSVSAKVKDLESAQERIRKFRPWYDENFGSLTVLRQLTRAFPGEGTVNAKAVEIRNSDTVSCTGTARDNRSLLSTLDKLRASPGVSDIKVSQLRGRSPTQFTFDFHWNSQGD